MIANKSPHSLEMKVARDQYKKLCASFDMKADDPHQQRVLTAGKHLGLVIMGHATDPAEQDNAINLLRKLVREVLPYCKKETT